MPSNDTPIRFVVPGPIDQALLHALGRDIVTHGVLETEGLFWEHACFPDPTAPYWIAEDESLNG